MSTSLIGESDAIDTRYFRVVLPKGVTTVDVYLKDRIDEAKAFFIKYAYNQEALLIEKPDVWYEYEKRYGFYQPTIYQRWLFDYCFGK